MKTCFLLFSLLVPALAHAGVTIVDAPQTSQPTPPVVQIRPMPETWVAQEGSTLRESIEEWGKRAGWRVIWDGDTDYPLLAPVWFQGSFEEAVSAFIKLYTKEPLIADIQVSQKIIFVTRRQQP
jgi:type IV pili sensor histidine kinase/response regulator